MEKTETEICVGGCSSSFAAGLECRLLDSNPNIRIEAVTEVCNLVKSNIKSFPSELILLVADRLWDSEESVRRVSRRDLLDLYRFYCRQHWNHLIKQTSHFEKIAYYLIAECMDESNKVLRSQNLDLLLGRDLFPELVLLNPRAYHWMNFLKFFSTSEKQTLEAFLSEKQRFRMHMKEYLRFTSKEDDSSKEELIHFLSSHFVDSSFALSCFHKLEEMKNENIFKALNSFVCARTISECGWEILENSLKRFDEADDLYVFIQLLSWKSSCSIFTTEYVDEICFALNNATLIGNDQKLDVNSDLALDLLFMILKGFPELLRGREDSFLMIFLVESDAIIEKFLEMLSKIVHRVLIELCDFYPFLERICLEGNPTQSEYAVSIIASLIDPSDHSIIRYLIKELMASFLDRRRAGETTSSLLQSLQYIVDRFPSEKGMVERHLGCEWFTNSNSNRVYVKWFPNSNSN